MLRPIIRLATREKTSTYKVMFKIEIRMLDICIA